MRRWWWLLHRRSTAVQNKTEQWIIKKHSLSYKRSNEIKTNGNLKVLFTFREQYIRFSISVNASSSSSVLPLSFGGSVIVLLQRAAIWFSQASTSCMHWYTSDVK